MENTVEDNNGYEEVFDPISSDEAIISAIETDLRNALRGLVDDISEVIIARTKTRNRLIFEVMAGNQTGYLIGKGGRTAQALRQLLMSYGNKYRRLHKSPYQEVTIDIHDAREPKTNG